MLVNNSDVVSKVGTPRVGLVSSKRYNRSLLNIRGSKLMDGRLLSSAKSSRWQIKRVFSSERLMWGIIRPFALPLTLIKIRREIYGQQIRHNAMLHGQTKRRASRQLGSYARFCGG